MNVLGIETSCDETAVSVVKDGRMVLSNIVSSSLRFHKKYGGVIPEIASRIQLKVIDYALNEAIRGSGVKLKDIDLIAVTSGPGLKGSLLVGICLAKATAFGLNIPLVQVNHLYAHIYAAFLKTPGAPKISICGDVFPFIGLVVSGGHTSLFYVKDFTDIETLGYTLDDACGEAFDKVAKILGLGYPGGPIIEKLAKKGNPKRIRFSGSRTMRPFDFSFSGIKTAVLYSVNKGLHPKQKREIPLNDKRDVAASFQEKAIDILIEKAFSACRMKRTDVLIVGGGVAANTRLRERFKQRAKGEISEVYFSPLEFCTDNAAMVAGLGYLLFKKGRLSKLDLTVKTN